MSGESAIDGVEESERQPQQESESRRRVRRAVVQVRREIVKAAAIHAVVDTVLVVLLVNLALTVAGLDLPGPSYTRQAIAVGAGLLLGGAEFAIRFRTSPVRQFEAVNPAVSEALRTARDAASHGEETRMARRLYDDVLEGLQSASSADLVSTGRVLVSVLVVFGLALATVQASVAGLDLTPAPEPGGGPGGDVDRNDEYDGLYDGDAILGDETDADAGEDDLDAVVGGSPGSDGEDTDFDSGYDSGGFSSEASYDAQQAGFSQSDDVENADIIREYNLRIRDGGDDSDQ
jgi:hypothetical protein